MSKVISLQEWQAEQKDAFNSEKKLFLSEQEIREHPQFKDASAEEIVSIINTLHQLALITYNLVSKELTEKITVRQAA